MPAVRENPAANHGNFLALLQFRVQAGDQVLKEHLRTAAGNALYTSKTIQNEMIVVCGDIIRNKLLEKIRKAGFFSVIANEAMTSNCPSAFGLWNVTLHVRSS